MPVKNGDDWIPSKCKIQHSSLKQDVLFTSCERSKSSWQRIRLRDRMTAPVAQRLKTSITKDLMPPRISKKNLHDPIRRHSQNLHHFTLQNKPTLEVSAKCRISTTLLAETPQSLKWSRRLLLMTEMALFSVCKRSPGSERARSGHSSDSFVSECNMWFSYLDKCMASTGVFALWVHSRSCCIFFTQLLRLEEQISNHPNTENAKNNSI